MSVLENYSFEVFWKNELTARVCVDNDKVIISRFCVHPVKQIFAKDILSRYQLNQILGLRCIEKERADINDKLSALGLKEYNVYNIVKKTHGVSYNDYIWLKFPDEDITAEDVLVRD